jgi:hemoglobin
MHESEVYAAVGDEGFQRLVHAFYQQIPADDLIGPMYPINDLAGAEDRLRGFLIYRFGGPQTYLEDRGHPRLRGRHAPFKVDQSARDRWILLMNRAFEKVDLPVEAVAVMKPFFEQVASFLMNH